MPSEILVIAGIVFGTLLIIAFLVPQNGSAQHSGQRTGQAPRTHNLAAIVANLDEHDQARRLEE